MKRRPAPRVARLKVVCPHDCPDTCVMTVDVEDGRAVAIGGDPDHRFTQGFLCAKVNQYLDRVYSPDRILHPLRRVGRKGEGRFERISWDEALDDDRRALPGDHRRARRRRRSFPIPTPATWACSRYGSMDRRFFHALGASLLDRTICVERGRRGLQGHGAASRSASTPRRSSTRASSWPGAPTS